MQNDKSKFKMTVMFSRRELFTFMKEYQFMFKM